MMRIGLENLGDVLQKMYRLQYRSFGFQTKSNYLDGELAMRFYQ